MVIPFQVHSSSFPPCSVSQEANMYGFHQWAPLNLCILFRFDQQGKGVEGHRQESREGNKSKVGIFILYPFSSLPSGSACALCPSKKVTSPFSWSCLHRCLQILLWFHHFPPQIMVPPPITSPGKLVYPLGLFFALHISFK